MTYMRSLQDKHIINADVKDTLIHNIPVHVLSRIKTHSIQRITNDIKELCIANYSEECTIENCYICNKTRHNDIQ